MDEWCSVCETVRNLCGHSVSSLWGGAIPHVSTSALQISLQVGIRDYVLDVLILLR